MPRKLLALIMLLPMLLLSACGWGLFPIPAPTEAPTSVPTAAPTEAATDTSAPTDTPRPADTPSPTADAVGDFAKAAIGEAKLRMDEVIAFIEAHPCPLKSAVYPFVPANRRAELDGEAAAAYDSMLTSAQGFEELKLECGGDAMEAAKNALFFDHPEIEVYFDMEKTKGNGKSFWQSVFFLPSGRYYKSADDMTAVRGEAEALRAVGEYVASRIPKSFSAIDRYRAIAYYIALTTDYAYVHGETPRYATNAYGALIKGGSICQGYAIGFEYLCRIADIDCRRVRNRFNDANMHFWDIVTLDGGTYYVDVTWSDGGSNSYRESDFYTWFLFPAEWQHEADDGSKTTGASINKDRW